MVANHFRIECKQRYTLLIFRFFERSISKPSPWNLHHFIDSSREIPYTMLMNYTPLYFHSPNLHCFSAESSREILMVRWKLSITTTKSGVSMDSCPSFTTFQKSECTCWSWEGYPLRPGKYSRYCIQSILIHHYDSIYMVPSCSQSRSLRNVRLPEFYAFCLKYFVFTISEIPQWASMVSPLFREQLARYVIFELKSVTWFWLLFYPTKR